MGRGREYPGGGDPLYGVNMVRVSEKKGAKGSSPKRENEMMIREKKGCPR